jgi:hypothetical protein
MSESVNLMCPFCGQSFEFQIDASLDSQTLTTDCEVCCRPIQISYECADGEVLRIEAEPG